MAKRRDKPPTANDPLWTSDIEPAPGDLKVVHALVNTLDPVEGTDHLSSPRILSNWLTGWRLIGQDVAVTLADLDRIVAVRSGFRSLLFVNSGVALNDPKIAENLDQISSTAPICIRIGPDAQARIEPAADGIDGALARLFQVFAQAQEDGTWSRLKICRLKACQTAFYDASRNQARVWCRNRCGNLLSSRASRRRYA